MESRSEFLNSLRNFNPKYDIDVIGKAFDVANQMHEGQLRKSGEPYIIHPMAVAKILAELGMDEETIEAGLLHDVVEDTTYTSEDLVRDFGEEVGLLVDGVTKLTSLRFETKEERQAENLRRMFLAMSKDIRVLIIKLSDRLHNLRTINYMSEEKIREKCRETLDIYAPLASRLGIYAMKMELEDIAMKHLYPEEYKAIADALNAKKDERNAAIDHVVEEIKESLEDLHIDYDIYGRSKHFYSIFKKMQFQKKGIDEIFDLMAVRIIVESVRDCYAVLGIVHTMWTPIPGRFKDYVAMPKPNMYQSIHTTVMGDEGTPFEIQIRTYEMHHIAEYGIAAHWKYKEGKTKEASASTEEVKLSWLRQALEWQQETKDPTEFMESLKVDLFSGQVFVFTPAGDVIDLPAGATPLDFAFKIHTDVGAKCIGAKVNGKMVPIDHTLDNGDIIEIMTSPNSSGPSIDWLNIAKSSAARAKIRQWLKKENKNDSIDRGKEQMDRYLRRKGYDPRDILKNSYVAKAAKELGLGKPEEVYTQVENGGTVIGKVAGILTGYYKADQEEEKKKQENLTENLISEESQKKRRHEDNEIGIVVKGADGMDNLLIRMSKCCNPVPGDDIVGYITKGRGISVHRKDCVNMTSLPEEERGRLIEVAWAANGGGAYDAEISIEADDRKGLFSDISRVCDTNDVFIVAVNTHGVKGETITINLTLSIKNTEQLTKLMSAFKMVTGVQEVYRSRS